MRKLILCFAILFCAPSYAYVNDFSISDLHKEIKQLRKEVRQLERKVRQLENRSDDSVSGEWGCYLNDGRAGGLFGNASTETEAKGKVLYKCSQKKGLCFEHQIKCSKSN